MLSQALVADQRPGSIPLPGVSAPTNVGVFRDAIVHVGSEEPPADAFVVDGGGGTLLGLFDAHSHLGDWDGPSTSRRA